MDWTRGRKLSLIVAGVDILIAVGGIAVRHGQVGGALGSLFFIVWSLSFIWFSERLASFVNYMRRGWYWWPDYTLDSSLVSFVGWALLVTAAPVAAIFID
jgi:hypothetical protein